MTSSRTAASLVAALLSFAAAVGPAAADAPPSVRPSHAAEVDVAPRGAAGYWTVDDGNLIRTYVGCQSRVKALREFYPSDRFTCRQVKVPACPTARIYYHVDIYKEGRQPVSVDSRALAGGVRC